VGVDRGAGQAAGTPIFFARGSCGSGGKPTRASIFPLGQERATTWPAPARSVRGPARPPWRAAPGGGDAWRCRWRDASNQDSVWSAYGSLPFALTSGSGAGPCSAPAGASPLRRSTVFDELKDKSSALFRLSRVMLISTRRYTNYCSRGVSRIAGTEGRPNVISWFDIEDPDGNEMRWYQVLTSDTQVTGERQRP
jgi:hypothetical protein